MHAHNSTYEVRAVYTQRVKAYQRAVLSLMQSRATKAKTEKKESALLSTMGGTFIMTVWEVTTGSWGTDGIVMFILPVLDMHHSDLSHSIIKAHEVFIKIRGRGWWEGSRGVETSSVFLRRYVNHPLTATTRTFGQQGGIVCTKKASSVSSLVAVNDSKNNAGIVGGNCAYMAIF